MGERSSESQSFNRLVGPSGAGRKEDAFNNPELL